MLEGRWFMPQEDPYLDEAGLAELSRKAHGAMRHLNRMRERAELSAQIRKTWSLLFRYYFPSLSRFLKRFQRERLIGLGAD